MDEGAWWYFVYLFKKHLNVAFLFLLFILGQHPCACAECAALSSCVKKTKVKVLKESNVNHAVVSQDMNKSSLQLPPSIKYISISYNLNLKNVKIWYIFLKLSIKDNLGQHVNIMNSEEINYRKLFKLVQEVR